MQIDWTEFFTNAYNLWALGGITIYIIIALAFRAMFNNPKILQTIPGASASIGVFFTFWVLYEKLSTFTLNDASDSFLIEVVRSLSGAFSTSIIGLFVSVISNLIIKLYLSNLEHKATKAKPWEKKHPMELLYELQQSTDAVRAEIKSLKGREGNIDLARIHRSQVDNFEQILREQRTTRGRLSEDLSALASSTNAVQRAINKAKGEISTQLRGIRGSEEHGDLASIHNQLQRLNSGVLEELQGLFEALNGKLTEMLGKLGEDVLKQTSEDLKKLNIDFTRETGKLLKQNLKAMNARFELQRKESETSAQEHIEQFKNVNKGLHATREQLNSTNEIVEKGLKEFNKKIQDTVDETLRKNLEQLEGTFKRLEELQSRSTSNLGDTTKSFAEAVDKNQQISQEQSEVLEQVKNQYQEIEGLRTDMKALLEQWSTYSNQLHHLQDRVADLTKIIVELDTANSLLKKLNPNGHTTA